MFLNPLMLRDVKDVCGYVSGVPTLEQPQGLPSPIARAAVSCKHVYKYMYLHKTAPFLNDAPVKSFLLFFYSNYINIFKIYNN